MDWSRRQWIEIGATRSTRELIHRRVVYNAWANPLISIFLSITPANGLFRVRVDVSVLLESIESELE